MTSRWWPVHDLRLRTGDIALAAMTEADLDTLAGAVPDDLELNPAATRFEGVPERAHRGAAIHQAYWKAMGTWSPADWEVFFVVRRGDVVLGVQGLEGTDFPLLRTVDTSSWLVDDARGQGVGRAMRRAVLALAFDHLGARAAITSAYQDNHASLGVSRSLGYRPNGESFLARGDGVGVLEHLRMTRGDWLAAGGAPDVEVAGVEQTRPFFGL